MHDDPGPGPAHGPGSGGEAAPAPAGASAEPSGAPARPSEAKRRAALLYGGGVIANWLLQLALAVIGVMGLLEDDLQWVWLWCVCSSVYAVGAVVALSIRATIPLQRPSSVSRLWLGWVRVPILWLFTMVPAAIGALGALQVIVSNGFGSSTSGFELKVLGVWSMLLGWAFMHWGYAQIYALRSELAAPGKVLDFPGTPRPGLVDHVYFAFTMGTTFAASDVTVLDTKTRWLVTVHSVISFVMNALVMALAFNTIMNAGK